MYSVSQTHLNIVTQSLYKIHFSLYIKRATFILLLFVNITVSVIYTVYAGAGAGVCKDIDNYVKTLTDDADC